jgi:UV DNA damage endonuclease
MLEAFNTSISTWGVKTPKVHYSESSDTKRLQAHSDYVVNAFPLPLNIDYDIMIEAKQKELALLKYRELFNF